MTSAMQIRANQQNALHSTGPKSSEGKAISRQNALKHGLLSKDMLVHGEKRLELEEFRSQLYIALFPEGALEETLVERIINLMWRLKRIVRFEGFIFETKDRFEDDGRRNPCEMFYGSTGEAFTALSRYETMLERSFYKAVHELQRLQAMRMGQTVIAPLRLM